MTDCSTLLNGHFIPTDINTRSIKNVNVFINIISILYHLQLSITA